jgi:hypothetical protein
VTRIRLYAHPLRNDVQLFDAESICDWLLSHYGERPDVVVQVYAGEPSAETDITGNVQALVAGGCDEYVVLQSPGEGFTVYEIIQIVVAVVSVAMALSAQPPSMPNNVNRTQQSPNNALGSRENQLRVGQRVEDIYGTVKSIPSLMMPTYDKYFDNRKFEYGYYCISRGYISATEISDGNSLIANISGTSAAVYWPFTSPNGGDPVVQIGDAIIDPVLTVTRSVEVDGITLRPLNELRILPGDHYNFTPDAGGDILRQHTKAPNLNSLVDPGDQIDISMVDLTTVTTDTATVFLGQFLSQREGPDDTTWVNPFATIGVGDIVTVTSDDGTYAGVYTVTHMYDDGKLNVTAPPADGGPHTCTFSVTHNYTGRYDVAGVADGYVILVTSSWPAPIYAPADVSVVSDTPISEYTDWVTLPDQDRTEVWVNIVAPNGLVKDNGGQASQTDEFDIEIEKLNATTLVPTGTVEIVSGSLSGSTQEERADTFEHVTAWVGPARVRMRRTSQHDFDFEGTVIDEIKWADLYSVTPVDQDHFGNKTTIHTITEATNRSTAVKTRQLNCIASRLIPTYNGVGFSGQFDFTGELESGSIHASSKLVDIIAAISVDPKIGLRDLETEVDIGQMWGVQQQLDAWNSACGQFNYTLDTDNMSFEETVLAVANAGFCIAYRQSGKIRLALDRPQLASTALFTHRNKKPHADTITRKFANDSDYDGVEFTYSDPDTQQSETITLPLDGSATKLQKFEIPGIRDFTQAWFRANREYRKLLGQRITIETSTTQDARSLLPNARIDIVDNTRFKSFDGEVIAQSGLTLTLSQDVEFMGTEVHSIVLMHRDGTIESIVATPTGVPNQIVIAHAPSEAIVTTQGPEGVRTIFSFGSDSARAAQAYLVQEIDLSDGQYPVVRGVNYSASYYAADTLPVPAKGPIISGGFPPASDTFYLLTDTGGGLLTEAGEAIVQE